MLALLIVFLLPADNAQATALAQEAAALAQAGNYTAARDRLWDAHQLAPREAAIMFNLGQVREALHEQAAAADAYQEYLRLAPGATDGDEVRGRIARLRGGTAEVISPQAKAHVAKGQAFFTMERLPEAEAEFKEAERLAPSWGAPQFNLGVVYETQSRFGEAVARFRRYLPLAPAEEAGDLQARIASDEIKQEDARRAAVAQRVVDEQQRVQEGRHAAQAAEAAREQQAAVKRQQAAVAEQAEQERQDHLARLRRTGVVVAIGGLALGAAAGGFMGWQYSKVQGEIDSGMYNSNPTLLESKKSSANLDLVLAVTLGAAGGLFVIVGVGLLIKGMDSDPPAKVSFAPWLHAPGGTLTISFR